MSISSSNAPSNKRGTAIDAAPLRLANALSELYKALKSVTFYPERHPLRDENRQKAYHSLKALLESESISLEIGRTGFLLNGKPLSGNDMMLSLARELFVRRVRTLAIMPDLATEELEVFLRITAVDPQDLLKTGGVESSLRSHHVKNIHVTELTVIGVTTSSAGHREIVRQVSPQNLIGSGSAGTKEVTEQEIQQLVLELDAALTDAEYLQRASLLAQRTHEMKRTKRLAPLLPALVILMLHFKEAKRTQEQRECALFTLDQVASGEMVDFIVQSLMHQGEKERENILEIVRLLGSRLATPLLQALVTATEGRRRPLAGALVRIGYPAVPALISYLEGRSDIVPETVTIVGDIGSRESLPCLQKLCRCDDDRIAAEAARAMAKIGGDDAEKALLSMMRHPSWERQKQAVYLLGTMKSTSSVPFLVELVLEKDPLLKRLAVKCEAATALGRIGDRRATAILLSFIMKRKWLARRNWQQLQLAVIAAVGAIRDPAALPLLTRLSKKKHLRQGCREAINAIEGGRRETHA